MEPFGGIKGTFLLGMLDHFLTFLFFVDLLRKKIVIFLEFDFAYDIGQLPMVAILSFPDELFDY